MPGSDFPVIVSLKHNIKSPSGASRVVPLSPFTLLVGPEGSGKSRIQIALELALTGKATDVAGRGLNGEGAASVDQLAELFTPGQHAFAIATFGDGSMASWSAEWKKDRWGKPDLISPPFVMPQRALPVRNALAALSGVADKAQAYFVGDIGAVTVESVLKMLSEETRAKAKETMEGEFVPGAAATLLTRLAEHWKEQKRAVEKQAREAEARGRGQAPEAVTEDDVAEAIRKAGQAPTATAPQLLWAVLQANEAQMQAEQAMNDAKAALEKAEAADVAAQALELPEIPNYALVAAIDAAMTANAMGRHVDDTCCTTCGRDVPEGFNLARHDELSELLERLQVDSQEAHEARAAVQKQKGDAAAAVTEAREVHRLAVLASISAVDAYTDAWTVAEAGIDMDNADWPTEEPEASTVVPDLTEVARLQEAQRAYDAWVNAGATAKRLRAQAKGLGEHAEEAERAQSAIGKKKFTGIEDAVTKFLHPGERLEIITQHGGVEGFWPSLVREPSHLARLGLSGMERTRVAFALAATVAPPPPLYSLFMNQDRAFSEESLLNWLVTLQGIGHQCVLTVPVTPPLRDVPSGWNVIDVRSLV